MTTFLKKIDLTAVQQGIYFDCQIGDPVSYNISATFLLENIQEIHFKNAFSLLLAEQEILRSCVKLENDFPILCIQDKLDFELEKLELTTDSTTQSQQINNLLFQEVTQPFNLEHAPLFRCKLISLEKNKQLFIICVHHIIADGLSLNLLIHKLMMFYHQLLIKQPITLKRDDGFAFYAAQEKKHLLSGQYEKQKNFWIEKFNNIEPTTLSADYLIKQKQGLGKEKSFLIDSALITKVNELSREHEITPFMFFLAAFGVLLSCYMQNENVFFSTPFAFRPKQRLAETIGCFIRILPVSLTLENNCTFVNVLKKVAEELIAAYKNVEYPTNLILSDNSFSNVNASAMLDITFVYDIYEEIQYGNAIAKIVDQEVISFPGSLMVVLNKTPTQDFIKFQYKPDVFKQETIELFGLRFLKILNILTANINVQIAEIDLLLDNEEQRILAEFNHSDFFSHTPKTIVEIFEAKAKKYPDSIALIEENQFFTYQQVETAVNHLAQQILKLRGDNKCVGIQLQRSVYWVISALAVLKANCAFVSIDPTYPKARKEFILQDAQITTLITARDLVADFAVDVNLLLIDDLNDFTVEEKMAFAEQDPASLAYIAYTSGSTGNPKGVMIENQSVVNTLLDLERRFPVQQGDVFLFKTSCTFDISITELFGWFMGMGALCVLAPEDEKDPQKILDKIAQQKITHINFVPSMFRLFLDLLSSNSNITKLQSLKWIFVGGEKLSSDILEKFNALNTNIYLENMYGPTECSLWATTYSTKNFVLSNASIPIGQPLNETRCYVVDSNNKLQPIGIPGELCLSGIGLARGYANLEEITASKFIPNPFFKKGVDADYYRRMYRTGDLVRWNTEGNLEYLNRIDFQVKVRGMRLELEEIEATLAKHPNILQAVIVLKKNKRMQEFLCAYYVAENAIPEITLRSYLGNILPEFMVPAVFIHQQILPLTNSGKIDRKFLSLQEINLDKKILSKHELPKTDLENKISAIWREILGVKEIGLDDNFFDLGGHSLLLIEANSKLKRALNRDLPVSLHFKLPTIRLLSEFFSDSKKTETTDRKKLFKKNKKKFKRDIAIIGISINVPGAQNVHDFWDNLKNGRETLHFYSDEELKAQGISDEILNAANYVKTNGKVEGIEDFDPLFFGYTPAEVHLMSPQLRILHKGIWEAFEDAGYFPEMTDAKTALFLGGSDEFDWYRKIIFNPNYSEKYQTFTLSSNHFLATRLAYKFNLKGPVLSALTACSTTLVTIHLACQSLILGESDVAVAGGVTVELPNESGYFYEPGMMFSMDGHCRPFDAKATGTVFSNGMGLVVLKRLEEALEDGDNIYAVIKGSAVNNDGKLKLGFTAPSVAGQAEAIQCAYQNAGIDPETVSYVEAHGTATILGDPIEVDSLTQAFQTTKKQFCMLGSVKGNVGHTDTAAGVVGVAKVALSLKHKYLPATVNYQAINPKIDIENTPFKIQAQGMEWQANSDVCPVLRAGINSFGVGGTNAHMVLEEIPSLPSSPAETINLLIFSAHSAKALSNGAEKSIKFLRQNPEMNLSDAAWTLQTGRKAFAYRKVLVTDENFYQETEEALIKKLKQASMFEAGQTRKPIYFMFSGQGSQYSGMAKGLYYAPSNNIARIFKHYIDQIFSFLSKEEYAHYWQVLFEDHAAENIHQTEFSQFCLFTVGYALAKTFIELGVVPDAMLGHSIGELTAATLAGVFELQDAIEIVKTRGRIMQKQDKGVMLAIMMDADTVRQKLITGVWLALNNTSSGCVVGGSEQAIEEFQQQADVWGWKTIKVKTSHAFHTPMMQHAAQEFADFLAQYKLKEPTIPIISNLTGTWVVAEQMTKATYWSEHILQCVNFANCLSEILKAETAIFLELGPGSILTSLALQHDASHKQHHFIPTVRQQKEELADIEYFYKKIGQLWCLGVPLTWRVLQGEAVRKKVSLPTYAFDKVFFPIEINFNAQLSDSNPTEMRANTNIDLQAASENKNLYTADAIENKVLQAYKAVLGFETIALQADFFELGGDSLKAVNLVSTIKQYLNLKIDIKDVFKFSSPETLIAHLNAGLPTKTQEINIDHIPDRDSYPLSSAQRRIYTLYLLDQKSLAYNLPSATFIKGSLNFIHFQESLKKMVLRHEALRTAIVIQDNKPVQVVYKEVTVPFVFVEQNIVNEKELQSAIHDFIQPFDLQAAPLFRVKIIKTREDNFLFLFDIHHIIADGTSMEIFTRDFNQLHKQVLPPLNIQYRDFAVWQNNFLQSSMLAEQKNFWLNKFAGSLPVLEFPTDFNRPAIKSFSGDRVYFSFSTDLTEQALAFAKETKTTLFMLFLSVWNVILARYANQEDIVVGVPVAGRTHAKIAETIGMFVNMLAIRSFPANKKHFLQFLEEVKENILSAFQNQDYQFDDLVQALNITRDLSRNALFDVCFDFQNMQFHDLQMDEVTFTSYQFETKHTTYDLLLTLQENKKTNCIEGFIEYATSLFSRATIERLVENYQASLKHIFTNKESLLEDIDVVSTQEKQLILDRFNETELMFKHPPLIQQMFEKNVKDFPNKVALITADSSSLTYQELNQKANALASELVRSGTIKNSIVGIIVERDQSLFVALLGVLKAGCAYVAIDPSLPIERINYIISTCKISSLIITKQYKSKIEFSGFVLEADIYNMPVAELNFSAEQMISHLPHQSNDLACVIFTSGSTGSPKGVLVSHAAILNFICYVKNKGLFENPDDRIISVTTVGFDIFGFESLVPLCTGHSIYLAHQTEQLDPTVVSKKIIEHKITHIISTVSRIKVFVENPAFVPALKQLKCVVSGGEVFPLSLVQAIRSNSSTKIYNMYGPTETTIWSTAKELTHADTVNIGAPIANTKVYIVSPAGKLQPIGAFGELCIAGKGLATGYLNDLVQTKEKFVNLTDVDALQVYRTGDRARFLFNGEIELKGRLDLQVKIRGYRVELEGLEEIILNFPSVKQAAVIVFDNKNNDKQLALYYSIKNQEKNDVSKIQQALKNWLKQQLPHYMLPNLFILLDELPVLVSGKIDKKSLPKPQEIAYQEDNASVAPQFSQLENILLSCWKEVLTVADVGLKDNFFDLGGNSLGLIQIQTKLNKLLKTPVSLLELFEYPTIESLIKGLNLSEPTCNLATDTAKVESAPINTDIAVIGLAGKFPGAQNIDEFWHNIVAGVESIQQFTDEELLETGINFDLLKDLNYKKVKGFLTDVEYFDPEFFNYSTQESNSMDPQIRLLHQCSWEVLENAGYDPANYQGKIGLFAGSSSNILWINKWIQDQGDLLDAFEKLTLNEKDFITTRLSYKLNLKGPSLNIQTACSTSLVAIHQAIQSLLNKEADMAIAGGVSITYPRKEGYLWHEGMIFSKDGHCRPFSEDASGIISGNGCGLVLLKPLSAALKDHDHIYGVIKGSAINNDGLEKIGYTAPSIQGQVDVIEMALKKAGINAHEICYMETHGTGTKIGDPIEIEALKRAWKTENQEFCAIGSVKANIGHLDAAAGVASFIKAILTVYNRTLPPLVNFKTSNPMIDFKNSPFYINQTPLAISQTKIMRVGVSSFGIGGTNAHIIVEQAPASTRKQTTAGSVNILVFSAKTPTALVNTSKRILDYLVSAETINLTDVAWTLQNKRKAFQYRKFLIVDGDLKISQNELIKFFEAPYYKTSNDYQQLQSLQQVFTTLWETRNSIDKLQLYQNIAELWCQGLEVDWQLFHEEKMYQHVPLPNYVFEKIYCENDVFKNPTKQTLDNNQSDKVTSDPSKLKETLTDIWREMFGCETIDFQDDFFNLGGDSLKAVYLVAQITKKMQIKISIEEIFKYSSFEAMQQYLTQQQQQKNWYEIKNVEKCEFYEVSSAQARLYAVHQWLEEATPYNLEAIYTIEGLFDQQKFQQVVDHLVDRHEAFRTKFVIKAGQLVQVVEDSTKLLVEFENSDESSITDKVEKAFYPFDLSKAPLFRIKLLTINPEKHIMILDMHHIIADQTSISLLVREFADLYAGKKLVPLKVQYKDFAAWQNKYLQSAELTNQMQYWLNEFGSEIPVLNLNTDFARTTLPSFAGDKVVLEFDATISQKIDEFVKEHSITPFMLFMATIKLTLWKYTGQSDLVVGTGTAGRRHSDLAEIIGMFVNTLAIRSQVNQTCTIKEYLQYIKQKMLKAYENQDFQFEKLIEMLNLEKNLSKKTALFDVVLNYINMGNNDLFLDGLVFKPFDRDKIFSKFELTWTVEKKASHYSSDIEFNSALFKPQTIKLFAERLRHVLLFILESSSLSLTKIDLLSAIEKKRIVYDLNQSDTEFPKDKSLVDVFAEQVKLYSKRTALVFNQEKITYAQLNDKADWLAQLLLLKGLRFQDRIAILLDKSLWQIISILGVLKFGGTYVPIDIDYPIERINFILEDSGAKAILTQSTFLHLNLNSAVPVILLDEMLKNFDSKNYLKQAVISERERRYDDIAYIMYTSGSTGKPKGILTTDRNIIYAVKETAFVNVNHKDNLLQISNFVFDGSTFDIFGALLNGACLVLVPKEIAIEMDALIALIQKAAISIFYIPTALFNRLVEWGLEPIKNVKKIIFGGEAASFAHVKKALAILGPNKLINGYGPTETTFFASYYPINELNVALNTVPIGYPMSNAKLYILDAEFQLVPENITGELYIGGYGVAQGYLNQEELTQQRFLPDPFCKDGIMFRTGDMVKRLFSGEIIYLERKDFQVKIRGYRIELSEIEYQLKAIPGVQNAVVISQKDKHGDAYLKAYYLFENKPITLNAKQIKKILNAKLPHYMIPTYIVKVDSFPLNNNGKVDLNKLASIEVEEVTFVSQNMSGANTAELILSAMKEVLDYQNLSVADDFFKVGGNSIKAIALVHALSQQGLKIKVNEIFRYPSVEQILKNCSHIFQNERPNLENAINTASDLKAEQIKYFVKQIDLSNTLLAKIIKSCHPLKTFPFAAMQRIFYARGSSLSGFSTFLTGDIDALFIRKVLANLINEHQLLHSVVSNEAATSWHEYDVLAFTSLVENNIPWLDLQNFTTDIQDRIIEEVSHFIFGIEYSQNALPWKLCCLRLNLEKYLVIWGFDHIVFDGMSADLIRSQLEEKIFSKLNVSAALENDYLAYDAYVAQLKIGPKNISQEKIIQAFSLHEWNKCSQLLIKNLNEYSENGVNEIFIHLPLSKIEIKNIWNEAFNFTIKILKAYTGLDELPLGMVNFGRKYSDIQYSNCLGLFLDIIPLVVAENKSVADFVELLSLCEKHAINFSTLALDSEVQKKFPMVASLLQNSFKTTAMQELILFNFQGYIAKEEKRIFEKAIQTSAQKPFAILSVSVFYDEHNLTISIESPESILNREKFDAIIASNLACYEDCELF